jgi:lipopolysaccharide biosynthesis protein
MKIAVCLHLYHLDMWDEICKYLNNIPSPYELHVNMVKNDQKIIDKIIKYKKNTKFTTSPNKGMDIGGFLYSYKNVSEDIDLVLKIHTKKGLGDEKNPSNSLKRFGIDEAKRIGNRWFLNLMNGVLRNKNQVNNIILEFKNNKKCGMSGFKLYDNFDKNLKEMEKIFPLFKIKSLPNGSKFIGGTMFWVDNKSLKKYLTNKKIDELLNILPNGYVREPSPNHAMERIFGCFIYNEKKEVKVIL